MKSFLIGLIGAFSAACATPASRPHDMSVAEHESHAAGEEREASEHAVRYDPAASVQVNRCSPRPRRSPPASDVCWTSERNPTAAHRAEAEEHRRRAADHRAASAALRDAELRVCAGVDPLDRDLSPFERVEDIVRVDELVDTRLLASDRVMGATITFRQVPGLTAETLQQMVDCHLARNAALGHDVPEMPSCPLVPKDVSAQVQATDGGFTVTVRSSDPETGREVFSRAKRLVTVQP